MLRELSGALVSMADGPHDERRNSLELLNNILRVLSMDNVVRGHLVCLQTLFKHALSESVYILDSFTQAIHMSFFFLVHFWQNSGLCVAPVKP